MADKDLFPFDEYKEKMGGNKKRGFRDGMTELESNRWIEWAGSVRLSHACALVIVVNSIVIVCLGPRGE